MKPGRELDELIAEKVMGVKNVTPSFNSFEQREPEMPKPYSTDIAAAWEVVEKLSKDDDIIIRSTSSGWSVHFDQNPLPTQSNAESAPHAICLAALKAVGVDI